MGASEATANVLDAMARSPERNLLIVHTRRSEDVSDWIGVKQRIDASAPDIETRIIDNMAPDEAVRRWQLTRPSLVFSQFIPLKFRPLAGKLYAARPYNKVQQLSRLADAGLPVPPTANFSTGFCPPAEWGPFVVVKPIDGHLGVGVRLVRSTEIAKRFDELAGAGRRKTIVQPFVEHVDLAGRPFEFRVLLLFGRPLYASRNSWPVPRGPLEKIAGTATGLVASNSSEPGRRVRVLTSDAAVIKLARRAAAAFPELPAVAVDIIVARDLGSLMIMEVNPRGESWHLSSDFAKSHFEPEHRADLYRQFNALDVVAETLIEKTRAEAV